MWEDYSYIDSMIRRGMWRWDGPRTLVTTRPFKEALDRKVVEMIWGMKDSKVPIKEHERTILEMTVLLTLKDDYGITNIEELAQMSEIMMEMLYPHEGYASMLDGIESHGTSSGFHEKKNGER